MSRLSWFGAVLAVLVVRPAVADNLCEVLDVELQPAESPREPALRFPVQMVAWLEKANGEFVDTVFLTREVATFGLGNRPGRYDFNSGPNWPYGRRITTFPVWAHKHGMTFPQVEFQDGFDDGLSHEFQQSSQENHFCRPLLRTEPQWDARSCASPAFTDKGKLGGAQSLYPPRRDVVRTTTDDPSMEMYVMLNPFDSVSTATPPANQLAAISWPAPDGLAAGDYVLFVEVSREFDQNATYSETAYPSPTMIPYKDYGVAYRGQPSVVYKVPITIGATETVATASDYAGYGDPDGLDGNLRAPDNTISVDVPGSGALRLALVSSGGQMFRVRVKAHPEVDTVAPDAPGGLTVAAVSSGSATLSFTAPGDDGATGRVKSYDVRYRVLDGDPSNTISDANFDTSPQLPVDIAIGDAGTATTVVLDHLLPATTYSIGIRAVDNCRNSSAIATATIKTDERGTGSVDACFVATAAYGSAMANDVEMLRGFRDTVLRQTALGELAVEAYYAFGPALAGAIGESDVLRATARTALQPVIKKLRP